METNKLLKKLRTERKISQRNLAENISQRSTLASFEQNGHRISFETLFQYLDRLNISLEEFDYLLSTSTRSEKKILSKNFYFAYYQEDYKKIEELVQLTRKKYSETKDFYFYLLYSQYYLVLTKKGIQQSSSEEKEIEKNIKKYLDRIETWGKFEITIFSNLMFIFPNEYIMFHIEQLQKKEFYNTPLSFEHNMYAKVLTNALFLFIDRENVPYIEKLLASIKAIPSRENDRLSLLVKYFEGIVQIYHHELTEGTAKIQKVIEIFSFLGHKKLTEELDTLASSVIERFDSSVN